MACYAAVLSLFHTLNHINIHPRPPISLHPQQLQSLTQNLTFFQDFLERYSVDEDDNLESRITAAAYAAEDLIETHVVDLIDDAMRSASNQGEDISPVDLYEGLRRVIQEMDLIRGEVMEITQDRTMTPQHHHLHTNSPVSTVSEGPASTWQSSTVPVVDDYSINHVLEKLTEHQSGLQIFPIVGIGGIGKTTFAKSIYRNPFIVQHFEAMAWVTISQEYSRRNILQIICQEVKGSINDLSEMSEDEIGVIIHQHLWDRRYLVVMDDMWNVEAWDRVKSFFPDNNGSKIMITTRLLDVAIDLSGCNVFEMPFLDRKKSWNLLCEIVFGKLDCPMELENIGIIIAVYCSGLPLGIAVIGGFLKKSNMTRAYWSHILENLYEIKNLEGDEYSLSLLRMGYKELPVHLKPCFLYMSIFPEDYEIKMSILIKLWVAEGILRPIDNKSLEEVAEDYLKELIDRNLMFTSELCWDGEARYCKMHDLLRDVCSIEAQKQKFVRTIREQKHHTPQGMKIERRICIHPKSVEGKYSPEFLQAIESASHTRSLLYRMRAYDPHRDDASPSFRFRMLRVYSPVDKYDSNVTDSKNAIFKQANLRYLSLKLNFRDLISRLLSSCSNFWNLQTIEVKDGDLFSFEPIVASAIWVSPLLRHVILFRFVLPDPPTGEDNFVLENLHTLSCIENFKFSEEAVRRIPNIRKLKLIYLSAALDERNGLPDFCLNNLGCLQKLESLSLRFAYSDHCDIAKIRSLVSFPHSLKKLTLKGTKLNWEDMTTRIGSLPLLQFLTLHLGACVGPNWETEEGKFFSLRVLRISSILDLKYWKTDCDHFPCLERLVLRYLPELSEIPSDIGDISTLKSIQLHECNRAVTDSAKRIKVEQEEYGNYDLQVLIDTSSM